MVKKASLLVMVLMVASFAYADKYDVKKMFNQEAVQITTPEEAIAVKHAGSENNIFLIRNKDFDANWSLNLLDVGNNVKPMALTNMMKVNEKNTLYIPLEAKNPDNWSTLNFHYVNQKDLKQVCHVSVRYRNGQREFRASPINVCQFVKDDQGQAELLVQPLEKRKKFAWHFHFACNKKKGECPWHVAH